MRIHHTLCTLLALSGAALTAQELVFEPPATVLPNAGGVILTSVTGDLDEDGLVDVLVLTSSPVGTLTALLGKPAGGFSPGPTSDAGVSSQAKLLADFDGDGHLDLASAGTTQPPTSFQVALGAGDGSFGLAPPQPTGLPSGAPYRLTAGDVDADGQLDLVTASPYAQVLLGAGDGTFSVSQTLQGPSGGGGVVDPVSLTLADLQNDGAMDLVVGMEDGDQRIHLGSGGQLAATPTVVGMGNPFGDVGGAHRVADVDGDGFADLLVQQDSAHALRFRSGDGDGTFGPLVSSPWPAEFAFILHPMAWGDLDGDGHGDVAFSTNSLSKPEVVMMRGAGDGTFASPLVLSTPNTVGRLEAMDVNRDGRLDLIGPMGNLFGGGEIAAILNATYGPGEPFVDLGGAKAGTTGLPVLIGEGELVDGSPFALRQLNGLPGALPFLVVGLSELAAPFKGGTLWPANDLITNQPVFDADGTSTLAGTWVDPVGGYDVWLQGWFADAGAQFGFAATTGVRASVP
jgi:hypothetical protein